MACLSHVSALLQISPRKSGELSRFCGSVKPEGERSVLWLPLRGILYRATPTFGDNRRVDLPEAMIFITSNLDGEITRDDGRNGFCSGAVEENRIEFFERNAVYSGSHPI
jgi:hypothetical protein